MRYDTEISGKTTATIYFTGNIREPEKNCEAHVRKDGTLAGVVLDGLYIETKDFNDGHNIHAIDFLRPTTLHLYY